MKRRQRDKLVKKYGCDWEKKRQQLDQYLGCELNIRFHPQCFAIVWPEAGNHSVEATSEVTRDLSKASMGWCEPAPTPYNPRDRKRLFPLGGGK